RVRVKCFSEVAGACRFCAGRGRGGLPDERRAASHVEWFPRTACGARLFCNVLDEVPHLDSRPDRARRKFLDEDRIPCARPAARKHHTRGGKSWWCKDCSDYANASAIVSGIARRTLQGPS